jgi:hypothetical protein
MCTDICRSPAPTTAHLCRCVRDPVILPFCLQPARTCSTRAEQNVIMGAIDGESEAHAAAERHGREPTTLGSDVEEEELVKYDDLLIMAAIDGNSARCLERCKVLSKKEISAFDIEGVTALHHAAKYGHASCVRMLLDCGAEPARCDWYGRTPQQVAHQHRHPEIVRMLELAVAPSSRVGMSPTVLHSVTIRFASCPDV